MTTACLPHQSTICTIKPPGQPVCTCVGPPLPIVCQAPSVPINGKCVEQCAITVKYTLPIHPEVTTVGACEGAELALAVLLARFLGAP